MDDNGVPTAWEPVDMGSGGGIGQFRHIRKVTIPENITTDTSDVNFSERTNGGYYFGFDTDEAGKPFEFTELLIFSEAANVSANPSFSVDVQSAIPEYFITSFRTALNVGASGSKVFSMSHSILNADGTSYAYGSKFNGGPENNVYMIPKIQKGLATTITKIRVGALNNNLNGFTSGSWFDFWGR